MLSPHFSHLPHLPHPPMRVPVLTCSTNISLGVMSCRQYSLRGTGDTQRAMRSASSTACAVQAGSAARRRGSGDITLHRLTRADGCGGTTPHHPVPVPRP